MIYVNSDQLEIMLDQLNKITSDTEEVLAQIKFCYSGALEATELMSFSQYADFEQALHDALEAINKTYDMLHTINNIVIVAVSEYGRNETEKINRIRDLSLRLTLVQNNLYSAVTQPYMGVTSNEELAYTDSLQKQILGDYEGLQMINVASVNTTIQDEYGKK